MDLVDSCKDKLSFFRIKELKDVLTQLGLSKQGKKQDLVDRILAILSNEQVSGMWAKKNAVGKEEVAKLVDDTYRKMQVSGANDLASKTEAVSDSSNVKPKEEGEDTYQMEKIRCPCGSTLQSESMIKCEDPRCQVWQHISCVIIPEKPDDGFLQTPDFFYCELCRLNRADPFLVTIAHPLSPVKLVNTSAPADGTNPVQSIEKNFQLTRMDKDRLAKQEYDVQAWCMLLNDKVPFRMQWPKYADLQVNGVPVRAINRPGSQLLGANGRDDGPIITPCTRDGINKISLTGCDARVFCLGVRIVKRRTVQQILNIIPKEAEGELFEDALARVRRCISGGTATENADSDSDIEVVAHSVPVNLRCPMSGSRMKVAGRFKPCIHMGCFDLEVFVQMNQRSKKWQCPICLKNYCLENIIIDPYFNGITSKLQNCGEDVTEIEVKPDGSWRAKAESDHKSLGELGLWHLPDGSLCRPTEGKSKPKPEVLMQVKQENGSEGQTGLKLGMKKNENGCWVIRPPDDPQGLSSRNVFEDDFVIPMSSSATGSGKDGDDPSVNQDGRGNIDFSMNNGVEFDSVSLNIDSGHGIDRNPLGEADVIVLSDSDGEDDALPSAGAASKSYWNNSEVQFSFPKHGNSDLYHEDPAIGAAGSSFGPYSANDDDFVMPMWHLPSGSQGASGLQLFGSDADVSASFGHVPHGVSCPAPINDYTMSTVTAVGSGTIIPASSAERSTAGRNDGLVDNPLALGDNDPSLQIFLPSRPSESLAQAGLTDQSDASNGIRTEDWISLRLGGGSGEGGQHDPASANDINSGPHLQAKEASLPAGGTSHNRSLNTNRERSDGPFSFPRQRRSVRARYLCIDSD